MLKIEDAISETLLIPLYMKHLASQQPDPIIKDEAAGRIVSELNYNFSKFDNVIHTVVGTAISRGLLLTGWRPISSSANQTR